ncbi:MAG TPA: Crp/Fnr family transcriptional regulator [Usitatibacter sp.]|nr:Crp/Fnr family transcriptional regulator [Usitatibacter sp.]
MPNPVSRPNAAIPAALRPLAREVRVAKGEWVFRKGEAVHSVFFVLDGEVRLSRFSKGGGEIALHRAGRGEFFAEAALGAARYHCNAIASRDSALLAFPAGKVRALLGTDATFAREWIALLARQLQRARARLERLALKFAAERVVHYLQTEGAGDRHEVHLQGTVKDLARELGLTHEALYRTLARLKRERVVGHEGASLFLLP